MFKKLKTRNAIKTRDQKFYIEHGFQHDVFSTSLSSNFTSADAHEVNLNCAIKENHLLEHAEFSFGKERLIAKYDRIDVISGDRSHYLDLVNAASEETLKSWVLLYSSFINLPEAISTMCTLFDNIYGDHDESNSKSSLNDFLQKKHETIHEIAFFNLFNFNFIENNLYLVQDNVFEHRKEQLLMQVSVFCQLAEEAKMTESYNPWYYYHNENIFVVADLLLERLTENFEKNKLTSEQIKVLENG